MQKSLSELMMRKVPEWEGADMGRLKSHHKSMLFYAPRLLSLGLLGILGTLAVQAFLDERQVSEDNYSFVIYLVPVFVLLFITTVSWFKSRVGGTLFIIGGFFYAFMVDDNSVSLLAMVATPLILLGLLFHLSQYVYEK